MSKSSESSSSHVKLKSNPSSSSSLTESESTNTTSTSMTSTKWGSFSLFGKSHPHPGPQTTPGQSVVDASCGVTTSRSPSSSLQSSPISVKRCSLSEFEGSASATTTVSGDVDEFEMFFGRFWSEVAVFSFDKGKEIAEKEKERALKNPGQSQQGSPSSGFTWVIITTALAQLSQTEKAYVNLTFLAPKGFLRKDSNLKSTLDSVKVDLKKIAESSITSLPTKHSHPQVASALLVLVNLRLEMTEFYEKLSLYGSAKNVEISDLITDIETIVEKFSEEQNCAGDSISILNGILNSINWELVSISNLLKAMHSMQTWSYLESTTAIQLANTNLLLWNELVQTNLTTVKKSSFYSTTPTLPTLFLWIKKLKGMLISKYTLYFYELLAKHSNSTFDIRNYSTKLPVDYHSRLSGFQKKSDALCVCIVFDARGTTFYRNGYQFPGRTVETVEGLDSFPSIVSIPAKPVQHWPSVVMIISDKANELTADKTVAIFDSRIQLTYFVQKIDVRMFLVIMYETKKSEKDAYTLKFLTDLAVELKGAKIFSTLKCFKV